jgi:hypothetical protein
MWRKRACEVVVMAMVVIIEGTIGVLCKRELWNEAAEVISPHAEAGELCKGSKLCWYAADEVVDPEMK